jgi:hypothetical protein
MEKRQITRQELVAARITGRQPNTLAEFARKHATRFKY